jgi:hypothetical protein
LIEARRRWQTGSDPHTFDLVASVLDASTCQSDIVNALSNPPFEILKTRGRDEWEVRANGIMVLRYKLVEHENFADVEICGEMRI